MSVITSEITSMQNMTAMQKAEEMKNRTTSTDTSDPNMFLTLMLQQLQNQDPTQPTDNTEWLAQLAQYSSLEQMTQMNEGLENCVEYISAMYADMAYNSEISQTLSMIGKEVTLQIPDEKDSTKYTEVSGTVTEANFKDGTGKIKVNGEYYSIAYITSIREPGESSAEEPSQLPSSGSDSETETTTNTAATKQSGTTKSKA